MSNTIAFSPAIAAAIRPPLSHDSLSTPATASTSHTSLKSRIVSPISLFTSQSRIKRAISRKTPIITIRCDVSVNSVVTEADPSSSEAEEKAKVGSRVRVTAPLKVYHVNRVPEVDLEGMEGKLKDYVAVWKGKQISANLPYKVEFFKEIEGRGLVKFVAHLKEDEFDFIDP